MDLKTGQLSIIKTNVGDGHSINAIGYHSGENVMYGVSASQSTASNLIRIFPDGSYGLPFSIAPSYNAALSPAYLSYSSGDIDENFQYWANTGGQFYSLNGGTNTTQDWIQMNLNTTSSTYGQVISTGQSTTPYVISDWAYVPGSPGYLWALGQQVVAANGNNPKSYNTIVMRWDRTLHTWSTQRTVTGQPGTATWGAVYATSDGYLFGTENVSGQIWKFAITNVANEGGTYITAGNPSSQNDGARCVSQASVAKKRDDFSHLYPADPAAM